MAPQSSAQELFKIDGATPIHVKDLSSTSLRPGELPKLEELRYTQSSKEAPASREPPLEP